MSRSVKSGVAVVCRSCQTLELQEMGKLITQTVLTALSFFVMDQALFWPLIMKPGTPLEWWQNYYAAQIGQYVGLPVWFVLLEYPFEGKAQLVVAWTLVVAWAGFIFWLSGAVLKLVQNIRKKEF